MPKSKIQKNLCSFAYTSSNTKCMTECMLLRSFRHKNY